MKLNLKICLGLGLGCALAGLSTVPSLADEVYTRTTETDIAPNLIVTPSSSTVTTTKTIETMPTSSVILAPSPYLADDTISRSTTIIKERPASNTCTTASISSSLDNHPNYGERIRLLRQQLDKGIANGWITSDRATQLSNRLSDLQSREATVRGAGFLKVDCDSFEKDLTGFNIDLAHSMEGHTM